MREEDRGKTLLLVSIAASQCASQELPMYKSYFDHFVTWKLTKKAVLRCLENRITGIYADGWLNRLVEIQLRNK